MLLVSRPFGSTLTSQQVAPEGLVFKVDDCSLNRVSLLSGAGEGREAPVAGEEPGELNAVPELLQRPYLTRMAGLVVQSEAIVSLPPRVVPYCATSEERLESVFP